MEQRRNANLVQVFGWKVKMLADNHGKFCDASGMAARVWIFFVNGGIGLVAPVGPGWAPVRRLSDRAQLLVARRLWGTSDDWNAGGKKGPRARPRHKLPRLGMCHDVPTAVDDKNDASAHAGFLQ